MHRYSRNFNPPAPVVPLRLANDQSTLSEDALGVLDTGASVTVIPQTLASKLQLRRQGSGTIVAAGGTRTDVSAYLAHLEVADVSLGAVVVFAMHIPHILLGRDTAKYAVNQFDVTLRGKAQVFEMVATSDA